MNLGLDKHPCFNDKERHRYGRVHLPVAPRCNIQCNFCNRRFDCVNESRPGVSSVILQPMQSLEYLNLIMNARNDISVVGIAGPGDPFANPEETMETLRLVREQYPQMLLCIATNGLNLHPYIEELAQLKVSHVTITINAVDVAVGEKIYAWIRHNKRALRGAEGMPILLENQLSSITRLKEKGVLVKINSIIIPGINDTHIVKVAKTVAKLGADIFNPIPFYQNEGSNFAHIKEPDARMVADIRKASAGFLPLMNHCARCRADAVGLLGEKMDTTIFAALQRHATKTSADRKIEERGKMSVAVASREGVLINRHLGEAESLFIYTRGEDGFAMSESRQMPPRGNGMQRWEEMVDRISDCSMVLVNGIGNNPRSVLEKRGISVMVVEGVIDEALNGIYTRMAINHMAKRNISACDAGCTGTGTGCG